VIDTLELAHEIRTNIDNASANAPRSLQKVIGPSEVGSPCIRRIGYRLLDTPAVNKPDTWLATIGTSVHAWIADAYMAINANHHPARYLVEHRVEVADGLGGSVDLYDVERKLVLDWKVIGDSSLKRYKANGVGDQYRTQVHLYAMGFINKGYEVADVGIAFLPRGGSLRGLHVWTEPYDASIAQAGIDRLNTAREVVNAAGAAAIPLLPATESYCHFCPFYLPASTELLVGCPGADK
jgi:hypothetical protein